MRLADGPRQVLAGLLAGLLFLALYFGAGLVWWLALPLAVAGYFALILAIPRRRPLDEIELSANVSAADVAAAGAALGEAAARLTQSVPLAPKADSGALADMAAKLLAIRKAVEEDPADYRATRSFITVFLPKIVATVEAYVRLAAEATGDSRARVAALSDQIRPVRPRHRPDPRRLHRERPACAGGRGLGAVGPDERAEERP